MAILIQILWQDALIQGVVWLLGRLDLGVLEQEKESQVGVKVMPHIVGPKTVGFLPFVDEIYQKSKNAFFGPYLVLSCKC